VKQITLMNQYRRKKVERSEILTEAPGNKREVLITEKEDLQVAAEIMFDSIVLKIDELDGSLRLFYEKLKEYVKGQRRQCTMKPTALANGRSGRR
jgi:DNA primase